MRRDRTVVTEVHLFGELLPDGQLRRTDQLTPDHDRRTGSTERDTVKATAYAEAGLSVSPTGRGSAAGVESPRPRKP